MGLKKWLLLGGAALGASYLYKHHTATVAAAAASAAAAANADATVAHEDAQQAAAHVMTTLPAYLPSVANMLKGGLHGIVSHLNFTKPAAVDPTNPDPSYGQPAAPSMQTAPSQSVDPSLAYGDTAYGQPLHDPPLDPTVNSILDNPNDNPDGTDIHDENASPINDPAWGDDGSEDDSIFLDDNSPVFDDQTTVFEQSLLSTTNEGGFMGWPISGREGPSKGSRMSRKED